MSGREGLCLVSSANLVCNRRSWRIPAPSTMAPRLLSNLSHTNHRRDDRARRSRARDQWSGGIQPSQDQPSAHPTGDRAGDLWSLRIHPQSDVSRPRACHGRLWIVGGISIGDFAVTTPAMRDVFDAGCEGLEPAGSASHRPPPNVQIAGGRTAMPRWITDRHPTPEVSS